MSAEVHAFCKPERIDHVGQLEHVRIEHHGMLALDLFENEPPTILRVSKNRSLQTNPHHVAEVVFQVRAAAHAKPEWRPRKSAVGKIEPRTQSEYHCFRDYLPDLEEQIASERAGGAMDAPQGFEIPNARGLNHAI